MPDVDDALIFDACLIMHAEHGGGNNSTFTVRTVSSSGANTYMAIAAGIASLSGQFHGSVSDLEYIPGENYEKNNTDCIIRFNHSSICIMFLKELRPGNEGFRRKILQGGVS